MAQQGGQQGGPPAQTVAASSQALFSAAAQQGASTPNVGGAAGAAGGPGAWTYRYRLQVDISEVTFARSAHYFVALQVGSGTKLRTNTHAEATATPKFERSSFPFELGGRGGKDLAEETLKLGAFVVRNRSESSLGQPKLLGSATIPLRPVAARLVMGECVALQTIFVRNVGTRTINIGSVQVRVAKVGAGYGPMPGARRC